MNDKYRVIHENIRDLERGLVKLKLSNEFQMELLFKLQKMNNQLMGELK